MARSRPCYEIFPAQAVMDGGRVRIAWAWQHIARSGAVRHARLYDTFAECLAAINRRSGRNAQPAVRVILDPAESMSRKATAAGDCPGAARNAPGHDRRSARKDANLPRRTAPV